MPGLCESTDRIFDTPCGHILLRAFLAGPLVVMQKTSAARQLDVMASDEGRNSKQVFIYRYYYC